MTIKEFEGIVWQIDGVRVVIRATPDVQVDDYTFKNAFQSNLSVTKFLNVRILPFVRGYEAFVIDGKGEIPHGRTLVSSVRESYGR